MATQGTCRQLDAILIGCVTSLGCARGLAVGVGMDSPGPGLGVEVQRRDPRAKAGGACLRDPLAEINEGGEDVAEGTRAVGIGGQFGRVFGQGRTGP